MENTEPLKFGHDPEGMSKRRISSILKAPRTSMKVCGVDQDEQEETRPIEKRRNSRRVSFATTNNVHVFSKDTKGDSPVLAPLQNLTVVGVNDELDKMKMKFATSEKENITGLDSMLNIPLHIARLSKENFFPNPVLPDEPVDRTILLGEDTGYMDMTQSHTIAIDNEVGMDPEFSFNIAENVAGLQRVKSQDVPSKTLPHKHGTKVQSDFSNFLASISNPAAQNAQNFATSSSKKMCNLFGFEDTTKKDMDKENLLPSHLTMKVPNSQPRGIQQRSCTVPFLEQENMDMTMSHTVVIDRRGSAYHVPYPKSTVLADSFSNDLDDMEITNVHTTTINIKDVCSNPLVVGENTSHVQQGVFVVESEHDRSKKHLRTTEETIFFNDQSDFMELTCQANATGMIMAPSPEDMDMELTGCNNVAIDAENMRSTRGVKSRKCTSFMPLSTVSLEAKKVDFVQGDTVALMDDEMEMTQCQTVFLESKNCLKQTPFTNRSCRSDIGKIDYKPAVCKEQSRLSDFERQTDDMDMDLTESNNVTLNSQNMLSTSGVKSRKRASFMQLPTTSVETKKVDCVQGGTTVAHMGDEMEMTQCQTVVLESKHFQTQTPFSNSRRMPSTVSGSYRSDVGSRDSKEMAHQLAQCPKQNWPSDFKRKTNDMDLTECNNVTINPENILSTSGVKSRKRTSFMALPTASLEAKKVDFVQGDTTVAHMDEEMEMTQCQTVFLESKHCVKPTPFSNSRKMLSFISGSCRSDDDGRDYEEMAHKPAVCTEQDRSSDFAGRSDDMELTKCNNVIVHSEDILSTSGLQLRKPTSFMQLPNVSVEAKNDEKMNRVQGDTTVNHMIDEMEMTQCQTVVLESKHCVEQTPLTNPRKLLSFMSGPWRSDVGIRDYNTATHKLAVCFEKGRFSDFERKTESCVVPSANTSDQDLLKDCMNASATKVDMDLTGCNTIAIDTKSTLFAGASNIVDQPGVLSSRPAVLGKDQMEMSEAIEKSEKILFSKITDLDMHAGNPVVCQKELSSCLTDLFMDKDQVVVTDLNHLEAPCVKQLCLTDRKLESSEKDCSMEMTKAMAMPLEEQRTFDLHQGEIIQENESLSGISDHKIDHALPENPKIPTITGGSTAESELCVKHDRSKSSNSRRSSIADLQVKLQNIAQCINETVGLQTQSYTAPISHLSDFDACTSKLSKRDTSTELYKETMGTTAMSTNIESTTPFNLKSFLTARLSLGGITPKLPSRPKSASPNRTEPLSANRFHRLQLESNMDEDTQYSIDEMNMIENEVFPEEDFSDTVMTYLSNKKDGPDVSIVEPQGEVAVEANEIESLPEMSKFEVADAAEGELKETNEIQWSSNPAEAGFPSASSHMTKVSDDTCSSGNSTNIKCEGISESTLRNSQFDSHIDGTFEHEFDFNKTLADGSITVNKFLGHFGANSVIHKARPSALPDKLRISQTDTVVDFLREKYIYSPKQRVYEADCQKLSEVAEGFKMQMTEQDKLLRDVNAALLQDVCAFSSVQLQKFGAKLKERRGSFRKRSKALSHEIKKDLYSELCKTTQESKQNLVAKLTETDEMLKELDECINDLEPELASLSTVLMSEQLYLGEAESALKAKQRKLDVLNSEVAETEKQVCDLEHQKVSLEGLLENLQGVVRNLENHITTLNSLNEWQLCESDEKGVVFTFLHNTVNMEVKLKNPSERGLLCDVEQDVDISFKFLLNGETSQPHARMVHTLLEEHIKPTWTQKYSTTLHIPALLHDVSLVVSRLRLLGEEIHQLKNWGGLRYGILHIDCVDTLVKIVISSIKAYAKFELSLVITPDYPLKPLRMQKFQNHIGKTRFDQIEEVLCSVMPAKNYLTNIIKKINADLL